MQGKKAYSPGSCVKEDLRNWFNPSHPDGGWKRVNTKGEVGGHLKESNPRERFAKAIQRISARKEADASAARGYRAAASAALERHNAEQKKAEKEKKQGDLKMESVLRDKEDPNAERQGKPINVNSKVNENMENLNEKNVPTIPEKWAQAIAQAKSKFDVYPSAYANGWASKKYKEMGGDWKTVSEAKEKSEYDYEGDMARSQLQSIINNAQKVHDMLEDDDNLPEWVQSKITLAEDYISTVANYMMSEVDEQFNATRHTIEKDSPPSKDKVAAANKQYADMAAARKKKADDANKPPFDGPYKQSTGVVTDKSGAKHSGMSRARHLAKTAAAKQAMNKTLEEGRPSQRHPNYNNSITSVLNSVLSNERNIQASKKKADDANKPPFDGPYTQSTGVVTDKSGAEHRFVHNADTRMARARHLAKTAAAKQAALLKRKSKLAESRKAEIVKDIAKKAKSKNKENKFQSEPVLGTTIVKND